MNGAKIQYRRIPLFSLLTLSPVPEITVEIDERLYLIRLMGTGSSHRRVHFANPQYTVTIKGKRARGSMAVASTNQFRNQMLVRIPDYSRPKSGRVRILPPLRIPCKINTSGKTVVPVLIFNPAPHDVTYVTAEKNKVVAAFTGDTVYDQMIFTASTFVTYADRQTRVPKNTSAKDQYDFEYFS
jgi:hypothetical protein